MVSGSKPTDPNTIAAAQEGQNLKTGQQNIGFQNANQVTPQGTQTWEQSGWQPIYGANGQITGYSPRYTSTVKYSPGEQAVYQKGLQARTGIADLTVEQVQRLSESLRHQLDPSSWQAWQAAAAPDAVRRDEDPTDRAAIEKAMMQRYTEQADPKNAAEQAQMAARGLNPGSQGWGTMEKAQQDAYSTAAREAYLASGEESRAAQAAYNQAVQQKYAMGADWAGQLNQLRMAQQQSDTALQDEVLKQTATLMGLGLPDTPQFTPWQGTQLGGVPIGDYIQNNDKIKQEQSNAMWGGIGSMGSALLGAIPWSDRRLKTDIRAIPGKTLAGAQLYSFRYRQHRIIPKSLWGTGHTGVMADEVVKIHPDAVRRLPDGYDRVDYKLLNERHVQ